MIDGGLAGMRVERAGLEENVSFGAFEPLADVARRIGGLRKMAAQCGDWIEAFGLSDPAETARGDAGEPPANVVFAAQFAFLGDEQAQQGAPYVPEADDGEVIGRNERSPWERIARRL
jgi:hypothetical protein